MPHCERLYSTYGYLPACQTRAIHPHPLALQGLHHHFPHTEPTPSPCPPPPLSCHLPYWTETVLFPTLPTISEFVLLQVLICPGVVALVLPC